MGDEPKPLFRKVIDAVTIAALSAFTVACVSTLFGLGWGKIQSIDANIEKAVAGVKATQEVTADELENIMKAQGEHQAAIDSLRGELQRALADLQKQMAGAAPNASAGASNNAPPPAPAVAESTPRPRIQQQQQMAPQEAVLLEAVRPVSRGDIIQRYEQATQEQRTK